MFIVLRWSEERKIWEKPGRTDKWWKKIRDGKMDPEEWKNNFIMAKFNFYLLINLLSPFAREEYTKFSQDSLSFEKGLLFTKLRF